MLTNSVTLSGRIKQQENAASAYSRREGWLQELTFSHVLEKFLYFRLAVLLGTGVFMRQH
jgi:hypothetical protein